MRKNIPNKKHNNASNKKVARHLVNIMQMFHSSFLISFIKLFNLPLRLVKMCPLTPIDIKSSENKKTLTSPLELARCGSTCGSLRWNEYLMKLLSLYPPATHPISKERDTAPFVSYCTSLFAQKDTGSINLSFYMSRLPLSTTN